jgi:hypothetical protein
MSYSFQLPEEEPICECRWDEVHQRMDREDCPFHFDLPEGLGEVTEIDIEGAASLQPGSAQGRDNDENTPQRKPTRRFERRAEAG